jgi:hypothetical protein
MRLLAMIVSALLPGAGHIVTGRQFKGILIAFAYVLAVMVALLRIFLVWPEGSIATDGAFLLSAGAGLTLWVLAFLDRYGALYGFRRPAPRWEVDRHLRQGVIHHLRGELPEAEQELALAVKLAPRDVDVQMHLARVYRDSGLKKKCRRLLKKCRWLDEEQKWTAEIEEGLANLKKSRGQKSEVRGQGSEVRG